MYRRRGEGDAQIGRLYEKRHSVERRVEQGFTFAAMIKAALFDMDGLLLDTEPIWGVVMREKAEANGVVVPMDRIRETAGLRITEVCAYWERNFAWPEGLTVDELSRDIVSGVVEASKQRATVLPGVRELLSGLRAAGWKIGLASSSPRTMIETLIRHFGIGAYFEAVVSADTAVLGKPHPEVYLQCAAALGVAAHACMVLEDTVNGCISAKAARMKVLAVPHHEWAADPRFAIADKVVGSLEEISVADLEAVLRG